MGTNDSHWSINEAINQSEDALDLFKNLRIYFPWENHMNTYNHYTKATAIEAQNNSFNYENDEIFTSGDPTNWQLFLYP